MFPELIDYTQPVYVSREDPNSRQNTIKEIQRRAHSDGEWPQVGGTGGGVVMSGSCLCRVS